LDLSSAIARIVPKTLAAPHMSNFMWSMSCAGLSEMPPVSKVIPLPTSTTGRCLRGLPRYSNTMKRGVLKDALPESLSHADRAFVYTHGLGWDAAALFARMGARARCVDDLQLLVNEIAAEARAGDHVLVMSNGGFGGIHERLLDRLSARI